MKLNRQLSGLIILTVLCVNTLFGYEVFEDYNDQYSAKDIIETPSLFCVTDKMTYRNFNAAYWLKVTLHNSTKNVETRYILFNVPSLKEVVAYTRENQFIKKQENGYGVPCHQKLLPLKETVFAYTLNPGESKDIFIKIKSELIAHLYYSILSEEQFLTRIQANNIVETFILSGLIILFLYNLFLVISMQKTILLLYLGYLAGVIVIFSNLNNMFYIWDGLIPYRAMMQAFGMMSLAIFTLLFLWKLFFNVIPGWMKTIIAVYVLFKISITLYDPMLSILIGIKLKMALVYFIAVFVILVKAYREKSPLFYYVFAGWAFFLTGSIFMFLNSLSITDNSFVKYSMGVGTLLEALTFSLVISYQFRLIEKESCELQQTYTQQLKREVQQRTEKLNEAIKHKNVLMRELHHRVKNNLQIISSLISLQANKYKDEKIRNELQEANLRIMSISILHDKLFQSDNLQEISMKDYIESLIKDIQRSLPQKGIVYDVTCIDIVLETEKSIAIGLIVNEAVTNAIKYAFDDQQKEKIVAITLVQTEKNRLVLKIVDNGKGIQSDRFENGFGIKMITRLSRSQLKGTVRYYVDNGLHYEIWIPRE